MKKLFFGAVAISFILSSCNDDVMDPTTHNAKSDRTAETVNVSEMDKIIATMFDGTPQSRSNSLSNYTINVINDSKNIPAIYVVNLDKGGYVLISATKKYNPVLAFSPEGKFNLDADTPEPLKLWVENTAEYASGNAEVCPDSLARYAKMWKGFESNSFNKLPISRNIKSVGGISYEESVKLREHIANYETEWYKKGYNYRCVENFTDWNIDDDQNKYKQLVEPHIYPRYIYDYYYLTYNVHYSETQVYDEGPIVNTKWGQGQGFNESFPVLYKDENGNDVHAYTGCATVAAAQVMYYYKHPSTYNWDNMPQNYGNKEISDLMFTIAEGSNATYTSQGTPISFEDLKPQMERMGYNVLVKNYSKETLKNELVNGNPIIVGSKMLPRGTQHAWVISGGRLGVTTQEYDEWWTFLTADRFAPFQSTLVSNTGGYHMYYVNWGWNGSYDGYYSNLDNIAPNQHGNSQYNAIEYEQLLIAKPDK